MSFPKIYTVNGPSSTSSATLPSWIAVKQRPRTVNGQRKRTKTQHTVGQLELVQDFAFPQAANKIKTTPDGLHAMGTGTYKPMVKVWDLEQLSVKFERVTDAENVDFVFLSDDWTKTLHLQRDRSISLHTQGGLHHSVRLPTYGRTLAYHAPSADALIGATGTQVFRFSLEEGRYMTPLDVARNWGDGRESEVEGVNVVDVNARHGLWSFGLDGGGGVVEFWDPRSRSALTRLVLPSETLLPAQNMDVSSVFAPEQRMAITAMSSHPTDGLSLAVGTSTGHTLLYDLRSPTPFAIKDQGYGEPIVSVDWLRGGGAQEDAGRVVSADSKVIKVWNKEDATSNQLSLHPPNNLVHLHAVPNSGLLFAACDAPQMSSYYIPELGPAPRWAGFLDNVTEEMGEDAAPKGAYRDFKFVDRAELDTLGLTHLIGTSALKPYMHGYFLSLKLYTTARLIANPQSYDEYRDKLVSEKIAAKAESRIRARREQPKVNKALAERLRKAEEREEAAARKKAARAAARGDAAAAEEEADSRKSKEPSLMADPRFKAIFENPEFEVDEQSREFALLNPATADNNAAKRAAAAATGRTRTAVESEDEDKGASDSFDDESEDEDDDDDDEKDEDAADADDQSESGDSDDGDLGQYDARTSRGKAREPKLLKAWHTPAQRTLGQRLGSINKSASAASSRDASRSDGVLATRKHLDGGMEMSFIPKTSARAGSEERDEYSGGTSRQERAAERKVERFGAGMEKGGAGDDEEGQLEGEGRDGRTKRRMGGRSGSKNAFRRR